MHGWEMEEGHIACWKSEGKRSSGRPKIRCEDNVIRDLKEIGYEGDWKALAQERVTWRAYVLAEMSLRVP